VDALKKVPITAGFLGVYPINPEIFQFGTHSGKQVAMV
jgi:hypothetical protein